jgi:PadR family transcriptional regulator PadR
MVLTDLAAPRLQNPPNFQNERRRPPRITPLDGRQERSYAPVDRQGGAVGKPKDVVQGTVDLLILKSLVAEPIHGWAIAQRIRLLSNDVLQIQQGSLYPALQRLEREGWIRAEWGASENNRKARFYELTKSGRTHLDRQQADWERLAGAIALVLRSA